MQVLRTHGIYEIGIPLTFSRVRIKECSHGSLERAASYAGWLAVWLPWDRAVGGASCHSAAGRSAIHLWPTTRYLTRHSQRVHVAAIGRPSVPSDVHQRKNQPVRIKGGNREVMPASAGCSLRGSFEGWPASAAQTGPGIWHRIVVCG